MPTTVAATTSQVVSFSARSPPPCRTTIRMAASVARPIGMRRLSHFGMPSYLNRAVTAGTITPVAISVSAVPVEAGRVISSFSMRFSPCARYGVGGHERWGDVERWLPPQKGLLRPVVPLPVNLPLAPPPGLTLCPHSAVVRELSLERLYLGGVLGLLASVFHSVDLALLGEVLDLPLHVDHVRAASLDPRLTALPRPFGHPRSERPEDLRHRLRDHQQNSHRQRAVDEARVFPHQRPTPSSAAPTPSGKTASRAASSEPRLSSPTECPRTSPSGGRRSPARRTPPRTPPRVDRARATRRSGSARSSPPPTSPRGSGTLLPTPEAGTPASSTR